MLVYQRVLRNLKAFCILQEHDRLGAGDILSDQWGAASRADGQASIVLPKLYWGTYCTICINMIQTWFIYDSHNFKHHCAISGYEVWMARRGLFSCLVFCTWTDWLKASLNVRRVCRCQPWGETWFCSSSKILGRRPVSCWNLLKALWRHSQGPVAKDLRTCHFNPVNKDTWGLCLCLDKVYKSLSKLIKVGRVSEDMIPGGAAPPADSRGPWTPCHRIVLHGPPS